MGWFGELARTWTRPSALVRDPVERGSARLLAACLLWITLAFAGLDLYLVLTRDGYVPPLFGYALLAASYTLSRTRWFFWGAVTTTAMFSLVPVVLVLGEDSLSSLGFAAVAPLFASVFLGLRGVLIVGALNPVFVGLIPVLSGGRYGAEDVVVPIFATLVIGVVATLHTTHRDWMEETRRRDLEMRENQLQQMQKMEAIGRLAGGIAHDFNNLLTVIAGGVELLQRKGGGRELGLIDSATRSARDLTSQLLTLSRQGVVDRSATNVSDLLGRVRALLDRVIGEDIEVSTHVTPRLYDVALAPGRLQQILLNLATNARDAMPRGGVFELRAENSGDGVLLCVRDTGVGMDEATLSRVFEPFFTTKEVGKGTGLGLAMVFGIVTQAGGTVKIESVKGVGSTFHIWLPRADHLPELALSERKIAVERSGRGCVLLVEDDDSVRELCEMVLKTAGYEVLSAATPREALDLFDVENERIELVLTDLVMPLLSGPEMVRAFHRKVPELPVLYMSGYAPEDQGTEPIDSRLLLPKPFRPSDLLTRVGALIAQRQGRETSAAS